MQMRIILAAAFLASPALAEMTLTSPGFADGGTLPEAQVLNGFGCTGANASPALEWTGAPEGTQSFVLTVFDPDAPTGSGWWHWTVIDIPAGATGLAAGASPDGLPAGAVESRTDFGSPGFGGACPPEGGAPHSYVFTLYALPEASLPLTAEASGAMVSYYARSMALAQASLTATYNR